jgi:hypothetical protein
MQRTKDYYAKPPVFEDFTVVELSVPSGRIIASDDLRGPDFFDVEQTQSINYGAGLDTWAKAWATEANVGYSFVGNTCPSIARNSDGLIQVVSPDHDEEGDEEVFENGETVLAKISTAHWAVMITDHQNWLDNGGISIEQDPEQISEFTVFDVTPGKYRLTTFSHNDYFDIDRVGRVVYAKLEFIEAY